MIESGRAAVVRVVASLAVVGMLAAGCTRPADVSAQAAPAAGLPELVAGLLPHVVNIAYYNVRKQPNGELKRIGKGLGSGFVVDERGIIVTNRHVTDGGNEYYVTFANNLQLKANLIYRSPDIDLALLQVFPDAPLSPVKWGDSDRMRPGDAIIAIGNPLGLSGTVTTGIVSATDRNIKETDLDAFIQIDAAINPGNSGGPLFNARGEAIGMNTALFAVPGTDASGSIGLNFAIPGNDVQFVMNSLVAHGRVQRGYLGADLGDLTGSLGNALGIDPPEGAIVARVLPDSPALQAGVRVGDILVRLGDFPIRNLRNATRAIAASEIDTAQTLELLRDGQRMATRVMLGNASKETARVAMRMTPRRAQAITAAELGVESQGVTDELRRRFKLNPEASGVVLTKVSPEGLAAALGFREGDMILRAGNVETRSVQDVVDAAERARALKRNFLALLVVDSEGTHWAVVPLTN